MAKVKHMGLLKFTPAGWASVVRLLSSLTPIERDRVDMTGMLRRLIRTGTSVHAVAVEGPWGEVDSPEDLALYERELLGS